MQVRGAAVCMLRCADGSYYVGSTKGDNMASRPAQHEAGDWERIRPLARKRHHGTRYSPSIRRVLRLLRVRKGRGQHSPPHPRSGLYTLIGRQFLYAGVSSFHFTPLAAAPSTTMAWPFTKLERSLAWWVERLATLYAAKSNIPEVTSAATMPVRTISPKANEITARPPTSAIVKSPNVKPT